MFYIWPTWTNFNSRSPCPDSLLAPVSAHMRRCSWPWRQDGGTQIRHQFHAAFKFSYQAREARGLQ